MDERGDSVEEEGLEMLARLFEEEVSSEELLSHLLPVPDSVSEQLQRRYEDLLMRNEELEHRMGVLDNENKSLLEKNNLLSNNLTAVYRTCLAEIRFRDLQIAALRKQLQSAMPAKSDSRCSSYSPALPKKTSQKASTSFSSSSASSSSCGGSGKPATDMIMIHELCQESSTMALIDRSGLAPDRISPEAIAPSFQSASSSNELTLQRTKCLPFETGLNNNPPSRVDDSCNNDLPSVSVSVAEENTCIGREQAVTSACLLVNSVVCSTSSEHKQKGTCSHLSNGIEENSMLKTDDVQHPTKIFTQANATAKEMVVSSVNLDEPAVLSSPEVVTSSSSKNPPRNQSETTFTSSLSQVCTEKHEDSKLMSLTGKIISFKTTEVSASDFRSEENDRSVGRTNAEDKIIAENQLNSASPNHEDDRNCLACTEKQKQLTSSRRSENKTRSRKVPSTQTEILSSATRSKGSERSKIEANSSEDFSSQKPRPEEIVPSSSKEREKSIDLGSSVTADAARSLENLSSADLRLNLESRSSHKRQADSCFTKGATETSSKAGFKGKASTNRGKGVDQEHLHGESRRSADKPISNRPVSLKTKEGEQDEKRGRKRTSSHCGTGPPAKRNQMDSKSIQERLVEMAVSEGDAVHRHGGMPAFPDCKRSRDQERGKMSEIITNSELMKNSMKNTLEQTSVTMAPEIAQLQRYIALADVHNVAQKITGREAQKNVNRIIRGKKLISAKVLGEEAAVEESSHAKNSVSQKKQLVDAVTPSPTLFTMRALTKLKQVNNRSEKVHEKSLEMSKKDGAATRTNLLGPANCMNSKKLSKVSKSSKIGIASLSDISEHPNRSNTDLHFDRGGPSRALQVECLINLNVESIDLSKILETVAAKPLGESSITGQNFDESTHRQVVSESKTLSALEEDLCLEAMNKSNHCIGESSAHVDAVEKCDTAVVHHVHRDLPRNEFLTRALDEEDPGVSIGSAETEQIHKFSSSTPVKKNSCSYLSTSVQQNESRNVCFSEGFPKLVKGSHVTGSSPTYSEFLFDVAVAGGNTPSKQCVNASDDVFSESNTSFEHDLYSNLGSVRLDDSMIDDADMGLEMNFQMVPGVKFPETKPSADGSSSKSNVPVLVLPEGAENSGLKKKCALNPSEAFRESLSGDIKMSLSAGPQGTEQLEGETVATDLQTKSNIQIGKEPVISHLETDDNLAKTRFKHILNAKHSVVGEAPGLVLPPGDMQSQTATFLEARNNRNKLEVDSGNLSNISFAESKLLQLPVPDENMDVLQLDSSYQLFGSVSASPSPCQSVEEEEEPAEEAREEMKAGALVPDYSTADHKDLDLEEGEVSDSPQNPLCPRGELKWSGAQGPSRTTDGKRKRSVRWHKKQSFSRLHCGKGKEVEQKWTGTQHRDAHNKSRDPPKSRSPKVASTSNKKEQFEDKTRRYRRRVKDRRDRTHSCERERLRSSSSGSKHSSHREGEDIQRSHVHRDSETRRSSIDGNKWTRK